MMKTPAWTWRRRILLAYFTKHPAGETRQDACLNVARRSLEWTNYANALPKQFLRTLCVKKPFGRQKTIFLATHRRTSHRIPRVSRETAKKQAKPAFLDVRNRETALQGPNTSPPERPKHYLSAHPIARWRCALTALYRVRIDHSLSNVPNTPADVFWPLFAGALWAILIDVSCSLFVGALWLLLMDMCDLVTSLPLKTNQATMRTRYAPALWRFW